MTRSNERNIVFALQLMPEGYLHVISYAVLAYIDTLATEETQRGWTIESGILQSARLLDKLIGAEFKQRGIDRR